MKHLIIIGAGGFAREVYWHAQESIGYGEEWDIKGFLDGDVKLADEEYKKLQLPVLGDINNYEIKADDAFICAIAEPKIREKLTKIIENKNGEFMTLVHKTVSIPPNTKIGVGCIFASYVTIMPDSSIGNYVIFNSRAGNAHDSVIGDYCSLMGDAGVMGNGVLGKRVYFAGGAKSLPHAIIEDDVYVGVHSVVFKRAKAGTKVFGNPAIPI